MLENRRTNWLEILCVPYARRVKHTAKYSKPFDSRDLGGEKLDHQSNDLLHGARRLVDSTVSVGNATGTGYTAAQVEDYQVYLWSFLLLGFMLHLAVNSLMYNISEGPQQSRLFDKKASRLWQD